MDIESLFVTGGTGFFGKALLKTWTQRFVARQAVPRVTVLTRNPDAFLASQPQYRNQSWLDFVIGDICDVVSLPANRRYSHVLHAAADSTMGPHVKPLDRFDQIVAGTRNILDYARACGAQRFLLASSGGVYGPQPQQMNALKEDYNGIPDPLNAKNAYSIGKRAAEHLCALYAETYNLEVIIARCFSFIGEDLPLVAHFAIGNFIHDALWSDEITVRGDGTPLRSYMAQDDLARWLEVLLVRGLNQRAYNVGSSETISLLDLAYLVRDVIAPGKPVRLLAESDPNNGVRNRYIPDISRARKELGLSLNVSLVDAIKRTAEVAKNAQ